MCKCKNIEIGSYDNQVRMERPEHMKGRNDGILIDRCLAKEIKALWAAGITTTGCCCGHNKLIGFIGVIDEDIPRMLEMGYKVAYNHVRPNDSDSFYPKTI